MVRRFLSGALRVLLLRVLSEGMRRRLRRMLGMDGGAVLHNSAGPSGIVPEAQVERHKFAKIAASPATISVIYNYYNKRTTVMHSL